MHEFNYAIVLRIILYPRYQQHVASKLCMRLWTSRPQTDRNTPSKWKIDLGKSGYNGFFVITDITVFYRL